MKRVGSKLPLVYYQFKRAPDLPATAKPWAECAKLMFAFLEQPRGWNELAQWTKERKFGLDFTRQMLAWLALDGKAKYDGRLWSRDNSESIFTAAEVEVTA